MFTLSPFNVSSDARIMREGYKESLKLKIFTPVKYHKNANYSKIALMDLIITFNRLFFVFLMFLTNPILLKTLFGTSNF